MGSYTFNTRTVFLLAKFVKHFEDNIQDITDLVEFQDVSTSEDILASIKPEKFLSLIFKVIASVSGAEETAVQLLAVASRRSEAEVRNMDGHQFIQEMREFLTSVDWNKLMGESLGLGGSLQGQPEQPKEKIKSK